MDEEYDPAFEESKGLYIDKLTKKLRPILRNI